MTINTPQAKKQNVFFNNQQVLELKLSLNKKALKSTHLKVLRYKRWVTTDKINLKESSKQKHSE